MSVTFFRGRENYRRLNGTPALVTIGTFDGIHLGHQEILRRVLGEASQKNYTPVMVTFHPHPRVVVSPESIPLLLTTLEEKEQFIPHFFRGHVLVLQFNDELKELSAEQFVREILLELIGMKKVIVGYDHAFGKNRSGNINELRRLGELLNFEVEVVGPVLYHNEPTSSSRIRQAMLNNDYKKALGMLGHDYAIYGSVERGLGLGRRLGYPTANVAYNMRKLLPHEGVYACWARIDNEVKDGMMFIGKNHFNPQERVTVEANLFDFDRDIYDHKMTVFPTHYIRPNHKFDSTQKLVEQIKIDKTMVLEIISKEKRNGYEQRAKSSNYR